MMTEERARLLLKELLEKVYYDLSKEWFPDDDEDVYEDFEDDIHECVAIIQRHVRGDA